MMDLYDAGPDILIPPACRQGFCLFYNVRPTPGRRSYFLQIPTLSTSSLSSCYLDICSEPAREQRIEVCKSNQ